MKIILALLAVAIAAPAQNPVPVPTTFSDVDPAPNAPGGNCFLTSLPVYNYRTNVYWSCVPNTSQPFNLGTWLVSPNSPLLVQRVTTMPSGSCSGAEIRYMQPGGTVYTCQNGTWHALAAGGTVTGVTANGGLSSTGGVAPNISITSPQGNGSKVQLSTGTATNGDCVNFDANGNTTDGGHPCGTVTSVAVSCGISGGTITTTGSAANSIGVTAHNGSYTIVTGDCGNALTSNTTATYTLPQAGSTGFPAGWYVIVENVGASGALTVNTTTSTFFGNGGSGSSGSLPPGASVKLVSTGGNWLVESFTQAPGTGSTPGVSTSTGTTTGPSVPGTSPAGTVAVNFFYDKNGKRNIKAFGAIGNSSTDDTAAINAATAAGGTYWPCGQYLVSAAVTLSGNSPSMEGESASTSTPCVTLIQGNSSFYAVTYSSPTQNAQYNYMNTVSIKNIHIFSLGGGININTDTIPTPPNYQANMVSLAFDNLYLQGPSTVNADASAYTAALPTISSMVAYGVGLRCNQCFNMSLKNSVIQNWGIGLYYLGDEAYIGGGNRITLNGQNIVIAPAIGGPTTFAQANNINIIGNTLGGNIRAGAINLFNDGIGGVKIHGNYFENYCKSSTWVVETNGSGMDFSFNLIDAPNNNTLATANGCPYPGATPNTTPQMVLDAVADVRIHENYLAPNGNSIPGLTLNHTNGNNKQYYIYGNSINFPSMVTDANVVPSADLNQFIKGYLAVVDSGVVGATGNGTFYLGDGVISKSPGSGFNFGGTGVVVGNVFSTGPTQSGTFATVANCASGANPAVCAAAPAGAFLLAATTTSVTVNTTAVNANSQIMLTFDSSLSTRLGVTCNTTAPTNYQVSARVAGTSFTLTGGAPAANPACFSYSVLN